MASHGVVEGEREKQHTGHTFNFFRNYNQEVRHLEIDYHPVFPLTEKQNSREREKQITKIVDDGGFKFRIFFVAASGFLASSYSLFAVDLFSIALFYVYSPCDRLSEPSLLIDELTLVGTIMGMLIMGHLADRSGRKKWYGAELSILIVATMGMVQSSEGFMANTDNKDHTMSIYSWISWWRFLLGFGIGAEYPLSSIITAEWASTESRGIMLSAVFSMQSLGRLLSFAVSLGALRIAQKKVDTSLDVEIQRLIVVDQVWRWTVGIALIPAAFAILLRFTIPETPRYYASIMKDSRKGVQNAMRLYGRNHQLTERTSTNSSSAREPEDNDDDGSLFAWYRTWREYLFGPKQGWRPLAVISSLWAIMDVPWYGLTMDLSSALATLMHVEGTSDGDDGDALHIFRRQNDVCDQPWNKDFWFKGNTIYQMIEQNALRSIVIVCIASVVGSIGSIVIIDFFRRKYILVSTFIVIGILFGITGGTLVATDAGQSHLPSIICYAILQFVFNLGPNTLIFVLAAEIFPTPYRGTSNGIAAACGKLGAVLIRGVISETRNSERPLGIRLLVLIPFMLASAWISWYLPDVQVVPKSPSAGGAAEQNGQPVSQDAPNLAEWHPPSAPRATADIEMRPRPSDVSSQDSSADSSEMNPTPASKPRLFQRLKNIPLEDIAPNPGLERRRGSRANIDGI